MKEETVIVWSLIGVAAVLAFTYSRGSKSRDAEISNLDSRLASVTNELNDARQKNSVLKKRADDALATKEKTLTFFSDYLEKIYDNGALLPSLVRWSSELQSYFDYAIVQGLRTKKRPALKAAEEVKEAKRERRAAARELNLARNRVDFYESLAPWLTEYVEMPLEEVLASIKESKELDAEESADPVERYVPRAEWSKLSVSERNQLALDRYQDPSVKKSLWRIGIDYERYVGYIHERGGYKVTYHGALKGKEDLGVDLLCENNKEILVVQCKRLAAIKKIPVRENVIAQIYGASKVFEMEMKTNKIVKPVLFTTYIVSDKARQFANYLGVVVAENMHLRPYPMIKCNVSKSSREKIYHLPMDQMYDKVIIGDEKGECYVSTVKEAEDLGFRRAWRWSGGEVD